MTHSENVAAVKERRQQLASIAAQIMAAEIISGSESHRLDLDDKSRKDCRAHTRRGKRKEPSTGAPIII